MGSMLGGSGVDMKGCQYIEALMYRAWMHFLATRLPSRCEVCHAWPARPVCEACVNRFAPPVTRCPRCAIGLPAGVGVGAGVGECGACLRQPPAFDECHAAVDYAYPWAGLVGRFKFGGEPGWAAALAARMREHEGMARALDAAQLVLPLPLAPRRLAERGFNQALQLARHLAPGKVEAHLLLRVRETAPQSALDRVERLLNVAQAFAVDPLRAHRLQGRDVALIDDVMTSGASLDAAARALRQAGAGRITALVFARTAAPSH